MTDTWERVGVWEDGGGGPKAALPPTVTPQMPRQRSRKRPEAASGAVGPCLYSGLAATLSAIGAPVVGSGGSGKKGAFAGESSPCSRGNSVSGT